MKFIPSLDSKLEKVKYNDFLEPRVKTQPKFDVFVKFDKICQISTNLPKLTKMSNFDTFKSASKVLQIPQKPSIARTFEVLLDTFKSAKFPGSQPGNFPFLCSKMSQKVPGWEVSQDRSESISKFACKFASQIDEDRHFLANNIFTIVILSFVKPFNLTRPVVK